MVATFKSKYRRRSVPSTEEHTNEIQTSLDDTMVKPYKRRKLQKHQVQDDQELAKLKDAAKYYEMIDNVKLETIVSVDDDAVSIESESSSPSKTPIKSIHDESVDKSP